MTVKIWKFLASRPFSRSPENIPGTLKVNMINANVMYFFVIYKLYYKLYLNCNPKLIAEVQVKTIDIKFCKNIIPTETFCLKIFF